MQVIRLASDDVLKVYLPKYGDRLAVVSFANYSQKGWKTETVSHRTRSLMESLKDKVKGKMNAHFTRSKSQQGNGNAKRMERRVEVGWLDYAFHVKEYKQIYMKTGGGIKHETFSVDTLLSTILKVATGWFFPNDQNRRGNISEYDFFITDPSHTELDGHITVGDMYDETKVKILRLYIASKRRLPSDDTEVGEDFPDVSTLERSCESVIKMKRLKRLHKRTFTTAKNDDVETSKAKVRK